MDYIKEAFDFANRFRKRETYEDLGDSIYVGIVFKPIFNRLTWIKISKHTILIGPNGGGKSKLISLIHNHYLQYDFQNSHLYNHRDALDFFCVISQSRYRYSSEFIDGVYHFKKELTVTNFHANYINKEKPVEDHHLIHSALSLVKNNTIYDLENKYTHTESEYYIKNGYINKLFNTDYCIGEEFGDLISEYFEDGEIYNNFEIEESAISFYEKIEDILIEKIKKEESNDEIIYYEKEYAKQYNLYSLDLRSLFLLIASMNTFRCKNKSYEIELIRLFIELYTHSARKFYEIFSELHIIRFNRGVRDINNIIVKDGTISYYDNIIKTINTWLSYLTIDYEIIEADYRFKKSNKISRLIVLKKKQNLVHEFTELSHGHAQLIELLYELSYVAMNKNITYIENIESYLHPKMISNLVSLLVYEPKPIGNIDDKDLVETLKQELTPVQTSIKIYETQSDLVLKTFQFLVAKKSISNESISINYINSTSESKIINLLENGDLSIPLPDEFLEISLDLVINRLSKN